MRTHAAACWQSCLYRSRVTPVHACRPWAPTHPPTPIHPLRPAAPRPYDLRLVGPSAGQGLLLVWHNRTWNTVTREGDDREFAASAARVAW